jgi:Ca2+-binding EF-hand superfamily protein
MAKLEAADDDGDVEYLLVHAPDAVHSRPGTALNPLQADGNKYIHNRRSVADAPLPVEPGDDFAHTSQPPTPTTPKTPRSPTSATSATSPKPRRVNQVLSANLDKRAEIAVKGSTSLVTGLESSLVKGTAEKLVSDHLVINEFASPKERIYVPKRKQGNLNFYEEELMEARLAISNSPALRDLLYGLYQALPLEDGFLTEKGYRWLYKKLYSRVVKEGQRKDCEELAATEWHIESGGDDEMDFPEFYDAMFNFIDMWCDKSDEAAYVAYAETMVAPLMRDLKVEKEKIRQKVDVTFMPPMLGKLLQELKESDLRVVQYAESKLSSQEVYVAECARLQIDPLPAVVQALCSKGTQMKTIKLSGNSLYGIGPLIDVIRMNTSVTQILLKSCNLEPKSIVVFCHLVLLHRNLSAVDISGNQTIGARGAMAIHRMLCRNRQITVCRFNGTVPASLKPKLNSALEANFHSAAICREDFFVLSQAFEEMDDDCSGAVDIYEMVEFFKTHDLKLGKTGKNNKKGGVVNKALTRTKRKAERVAANMMKAADDSGDRLLNFTELLGFFYPQISQAALQRFVDQYEDEESPIHSRHLSCEAIEAIFKEYDTDSSRSVSITELRDGLIKSGLGEVWEKYKLAFERYDLDGNEEFSLEEFIMLMAVLDSCLVGA